MKKIVPPCEEVCIGGVWYRAGQEYEDGQDSSKKQNQKKDIEPKPEVDTNG